MNNNRLHAEHEICGRRGHEPSDRGWSDNAYSWSVCRWCGIGYRTETTINVIEVQPPAGAS